MHRCFLLNLFQHGEGTEDRLLTYFRAFDWELHEMGGWRVK